MPKVSNYELEHLSNELTFEKVHKKVKRGVKTPIKKNQRVKKIDY